LREERGVFLVERRGKVKRKGGFIRKVVLEEKA
jgi:hypothetical protein